MVPYLFVGYGPDHAVTSAYGQMVNLTAAGSLRQAGRQNFVVLMFVLECCGWNKDA